MSGCKIVKTVKLINDSLEETLDHLSNNDFIGFSNDHKALSHSKRYNALSQRLHEDYHSQVGTGAMVADGGLLTDHGSDHINTVINRAGQLIGCVDDGSSGALRPYEIYLLLIAIHFHDLANIFGRSDHEKRIDEMMDIVSQYLGDSVERRCIRKIACVHSGRINGDKDTISWLERSEPINGCDVRPQLLAGILRFSDELADDRNRANRILQALRKIPLGSEVYHKYAECLHSVMIRAKEKIIELTFEINVSDLTKKFGKKAPSGRTKKVYLLDEIFKRNLKTHLERLYCNRYMSPVVNIRAIQVTINVIKTGQQIDEEMPVISYQLKEPEERGYPQPPENDIYGMCESLSKWDGGNKKITGEMLAKSLRKEREGGGSKDA